MEAIHYVHEEGVYHRDLKLENLLFDRNTLEIKLCDFGFAVHNTEGLVNRYVGTPGYIAPELQVVCSADPKVDAKDLASADMFALGTLLFTMVFGHQPFKDTRRVKCQYWKLIDEGRWEQYWNTVEKYQKTKPSTSLKLLVQGLLAPVESRLTLQNLMESHWLAGETTPLAEIKIEIALLGWNPINDLILSLTRVNKILLVWNILRAGMNETQMDNIDFPTQSQLEKQQFTQHQELGEKDFDNVDIMTLDDFSRARI